MTQSRSDSDPTFNNPRVEEFNTILRELAEEKEAYYLDLADGLSDETGALPEGEAYDGIHLSVDYCEKWLDYLKNHAIVEE